jgi:hypothetical protein
LTTNRPSSNSNSTAEAGEARIARQANEVRDLSPKHLRTGIRLSAAAAVAVTSGQQASGSNISGNISSNTNTWVMDVAQAGSSRQ